MNNIDSLPFAALSLLPLLFALFWMVITLGALVFFVVMILRFIRAHERIARNLETLAQRSPSETKAPPAAPAPPPPSPPSDFSPPI